MFSAVAVGITRRPGPRRTGAASRPRTAPVTGSGCAPPSAATAANAPIAYWITGNLGNGNTTANTIQAKQLLNANARYSTLAAPTYYDFGVDDQTMRKLFDALNDAQKQTLRNWIGEPYQQSSWRVLGEEK